METSPYARILENLLLENPTYVFSLFALILARVMPLVSLLPFLGAKMMPNRARVGFSLILACIIFPFLVTSVNTPIGFNAALILLVGKELIIGFVLAFLALAPFTIAQMAGIVIDHQRGSSSLMVNDPSQSVQVSTIGLLYSYMMIVVFFWLDGPFTFLDALIKSYSALPVDASLPRSLLQSSHPFYTMVMKYLAYITALSCQLAAPSLLTILMSNLFLGIMNRLAPQVQITFLGLSLNAYLGDFALWASWLFIIDRMGTEAMKWMQQITSVLQTILLSSS